MITIKRNIINGALLTLTLSLTFSSCSQDLDSPVLPQVQSVALPDGVTLDDNRLFGEWEAQNAMGNTNKSYFTQKYHVSFQSVDDKTAQISHWFTDAATEMEDSTADYEYTYSFDGQNIVLTPTATYALKGASEMRGRSIAGEKIMLYTEHAGIVDSICTLNRVSNPVSAITSVDRTLPNAGETITVTGRNLQFLSSLSFPTANGYVEVQPTSADSKQMKVVVPYNVTFTSGALMGNGSDGTKCYSPAYMFCYDNVFFKTFELPSSASTSNKYAGTEFEYTISSLSGSVKSNVQEYTASSLPTGHSAEGISSNPDNMLSMPKGAPAAWAKASKTDDKKFYLRFSSEDRFQYVIDHSNGDITADMKCADLAIQMDIYVYTDGKPQWNTGYLSWRLNKNNNSLTDNMSANVAMGSESEPADFTSGWKTFTIPLSTFGITSQYTTLGDLIAYLKQNNHVTILTLVNWPLDDLHPVHACDSFQFNMANIRLVKNK